jgi:CRISPR/Cas system CMR-associated protein Cmr3 (group 5 of RAMP superfamily)
MISRSIYNLKIDTICMCDIPFDRSILQVSNGIRHVMPSTDRMLELTAKHRWLSRLTAGCVFQWVKKALATGLFLQQLQQA